jgi:DNA primase
LNKRNLGKDVSTVLDETNIQDLLNEHLQCAKGRASMRDYICPFHETEGKQDDSFSLSAWKMPDEPGKFRCSRCDTKGNAIDFLMRYHHFTLEQAVDTLMRTNRGSA